MTIFSSTNGIKSWEPAARPREKYRQHGRRALSNTELLAIILGTGTRNETAVELARRILSRYNNSLRDLARSSLDELQQISGVGEAKSIALLAALELGLRRQSEDMVQTDKINSSRAAYHALLPHLSDMNHEEFWVLHLNRATQLLFAEKVSQGGIASTLVDLKIVFRSALERRSSQLILAHNHPSGSLQPSEADKRLTSKAAALAKMLDIFIADHIIVAGSSYFSFADEGIMPCE